MVSADQNISQSDVQALFQKANSRSTFIGQPFSILFPQLGTGILPWLSNAIYNSGAIVIYLGNPYLSIMNGNLNNLPAGGIGWRGVINGGAWSGTYSNGAWTSSSYAVLTQVSYGGFNFISTGQISANQPPPLNPNSNPVNQPTGGWSQQWLSGYNRLRNSITARGIISGPWPLLTDSNNFSGSYSNIEFYYLDTGKSENVFLGFLGIIGSVDIDTVDLFFSPNAAPKQPPYKSLTCRFAVGGNIPIEISGFLTASISSPGNNATISVNSTMPLDPIVINYSTQTARAKINAVLPPGIYSVTFTITNGTFNDNSINISGPASFGLTVSNSILAPGISDGKNILKIKCPYSSQIPMGLFGEIVSRIQNLSGRPFLIEQYSSDGKTVKAFLSGNISYTSSTPGFWFGNSEPINNLGMNLDSSMPWNFFTVNNNNPPFATEPPNPIPPYTSTQQNNSNPSKAYPVPNEQAVQPFNWKANTVYPGGFQIMDSNGNMQTSSGGKSGTVQPNWATTKGAVTHDNQTNWTLTRILKKFQHGRSRMFSVPKYPLIWMSETNANLNPDMRNFNPFGWWIYRVYINRTGTPDANGRAFPPADSIPVTIGCVRNGSFVAFGTYQTGSKVDAMWPIFTNTPLAYQCAERVDIQATIISCGNNFSTGGQVGYPICATYLNDIDALLNLIP